MSRELIEHLSTMKHSPIRNYVIPGLTSWLVGQPGEQGTVRLFESARNHQEQITPHSHRFDFTCLVLRGRVVNKVWTLDEKHGDLFTRRELRYQGEVGHYDIANEDSNKYVMRASSYGQGETYSMSAEEIHSIDFSRDAVVLFFEGPQITDKSVILLPRVDHETINTFKVEDWMFRKE